MRVLAIKQPWAKLIAEGLKTIEVRSRPTNIRERIAIYATVTNPTRLEVDVAFMYPYDTYPKGYIIATAEIVDCIKYESDLGFLGDDENHKIPCADIDPDQYVGHYAWHLDNIEKLDTPIPFKMPKGAVVWANAEVSL